MQQVEGVQRTLPETTTLATGTTPLTEAPHTDTSPTEAEAMRLSAQRVLERHRPFLAAVGRPSCGYCHEVWPCPSALSAQQAVAMAGGPAIGLELPPTGTKPAGAADSTEADDTFDAVGRVPRPRRERRLFARP
jgi:hypothetical protein